MINGDKYRGIGMDGGEQLGRCLSFLDSGATEEDEEERKKKKNKMMMMMMMM